MGSTIVTAQSTSDTTSPIRALHSLCETEATSIVASLGSLAGTWDIERHESCDGHLSLVLSDTICDTTIIVGRDRAGIRFSLMLDDELLTSPYRCTNTNDAINTVKEIAGNNTVEHQRHSA